MVAQDAAKKFIPAGQDDITIACELMAQAAEQMPACCLIGAYLGDNGCRGMKMSS